MVKAELYCEAGIGPLYDQDEVNINKLGPDEANLESINGGKVLAAIENTDYERECDPTAPCAIRERLAISSQPRREQDLYGTCQLCDKSVEVRNLSL